MILRRLAALAVLIALGVAGWLVYRGGAEPAPDVRATPSPAARVERMTIDSAAVRRRLAVNVLVPAGGAKGRPLLVFLHGRGADERSYLNDEVFAALARLGGRAPVVAFPDGEESFWHDRQDGAWGRYVVDEVIPQVARRTGASSRRVAVGGISMGGFGAYDLARLHPGRFCAVGGHSAALWQTAGEAAPGAFDDARAFARHDVVGAARDGARGLTSVPVWVDTGDADPFRPGIEAFAKALRAAGGRPRVHVWPGGHDGSYWGRHAGAYMRFYAGALARC